MPITYSEARGGRAVFTARCVAEEADALLDWLRRTPEPEADLGDCTDLHTALAQLLMAASAHITPPPPDPVLAACLGGAGAVPAESPPAAAPPATAAPADTARGRARRRGKVSQVHP